MHRATQNHLLILFSILSIMHPSISPINTSILSALPVVLAKGEGTNICVLALYNLYLLLYILILKLIIHTYFKTKEHECGMLMGTSTLIFSLVGTSLYRYNVYYTGCENSQIDSPYLSLLSLDKHLLFQHTLLSTRAIVIPKLLVLS